MAVLGAVHPTLVSLVLLTGLCFACTARDSKTEPRPKAAGAEPASDAPTEGAATNVLRLPDGPGEEPNPQAEVEPRSILTPTHTQDPAAGSAAYFLYSTGIYRLDDVGWTRIFGPADRLLRGRDGALHAVDRVGVHRLADEAHVLVHVIDEGGASKPLFGAIEHVEVGPSGELWELLRRDQRWVVERVDPAKGVARWDESSALSWSDPLELIVDGDGRAWLVPEAADAPLYHKGPQSDWATISSWQREGETHEALAAASTADLKSVPGFR